jgi:hypothetical protein
MKIDNFHDITAAESMLGNVAGKSNVCVKFESHGSTTSLGLRMHGADTTFLVAVEIVEHEHHGDALRALNELLTTKSVHWQKGGS